MNELRLQQELEMEVRQRRTAENANHAAAAPNNRYASNLFVYFVIHSVIYLFISTSCIFIFCILSPNLKVRKIEKNDENNRCKYSR